MPYTGEGAKADKPSHDVFNANTPLQFPILTQLIDQKSSVEHYPRGGMDSQEPAAKGTYRDMLQYSLGIRLHQVHPYVVIPGLQPFNSLQPHHNT